MFRDALLRTVGRSNRQTDSQRVVVGGEAERDRRGEKASERRRVGSRRGDGGGKSQLRMCRQSAARTLPVTRDKASPSRAQAQHRHRERWTATPAREPSDTPANRKTENIGKTTDVPPGNFTSKRGWKVRKTTITRPEHKTINYGGHSPHGQAQRTQRTPNRHYTQGMKAGRDVGQWDSRVTLSAGQQKRTTHRSGRNALSRPVGPAVLLGDIPEHIVGVSLLHPPEHIIHLAEGRVTDRMYTTTTTNGSRARIQRKVGMGSLQRNTARKPQQKSVSRRRGSSLAGLAVARSVSTCLILRGIDRLAADHVFGNFSVEVYEYQIWQHHTGVRVGNCRCNGSWHCKISTSSRQRTTEEPTKKHRKYHEQRRLW